MPNMLDMLDKFGEISKIADSLGEKLDKHTEAMNRLAAAIERQNERE